MAAFPSTSFLSRALVTNEETTSFLQSTDANSHALSLPLIFSYAHTTLMHARAHTHTLL